MSDTLPVPIEASNYLTDLAARIRAEHEAASDAFALGLQHAIAGGRLLLEARNEIEHGAWLLWLRERCGVPARTASRYMELARWAPDPDAKSANMADLKLTGDIDADWDQLWDFAQRQFDAPFNELDFDF